MIDFLHDPETERIIRLALAEDIGAGDYTTLATIPSGIIRKANCIVKDSGIIAGVNAAEKAFQIFDSGVSFTRKKSDGDDVRFGDEAFLVEGEARTLLTVERVVLNILQRMSGIATLTRELTDLLKGLPCRILDTRKTTPCFRHFEKWAVEIGGGMNHRMGLYDMMLIKDNHIDFAGSIPGAILAANRYQKEAGISIPIEIETRDLDEVRQVLETGMVKRIMLDNMSIQMMEEAVKMAKGKFETEASGGITRENIREIAETGVDFLSVGALTHSAKSLDISLKAVE